MFSEMMSIVISTLQQRIKEFEIESKNDNKNLIEAQKKIINELEKKLSDIHARELSQWEAQSDPDVSKRMPQHIFQELNSKLLKEKSGVEEALRQAYNDLPQPIDYEKKIITLQTALSALADDDVSAEEKNKFLKACIDRIEYSRPRPQKISRFKWSNPPMNINIKLNV
jgi:hypothetical protein